MEYSRWWLLRGGSKGFALIHTVSREGRATELLILKWVNPSTLGFISEQWKLFFVLFFTFIFKIDRHESLCTCTMYLICVLYGPQSQKPISSTKKARKHFLPLQIFKISGSVGMSRILMLSLSCNYMYLSAFEPNELSPIRQAVKTPPFILQSKDENRQLY